MSESSSKSTFLIACGGTGGHLFPGIAIGEALRERGQEPLFLISEKEIDRLATEKYQTFRFERLPGRAMPKPWSPDMPRFLKGSVQAYFKCCSLIKKENIKAVLGMGGFTCTTPLLAARTLGVPGVVHEANAIPGKANLLNAKLAKKVLVGWEACRPRFPDAQKVEVTGTPVRPDLFHLPPAAEARMALGLAPEFFTVMVMGGSQGAQGINEALVGMAPRLAGYELQFIHMTGAGGAEKVRNGYAAAGVRAHVVEFCQDVSLVYAASNFAICRSGASSLTEMSVVGLPGLLIPYPFAADDHQTRNAEVFTAIGACEMLRQAELTSAELARIVHHAIADPERTRQMGDKMKSLAPERSAERIAELLMTL